eukprot:12755399-Alexandrium_andersonii.AAC.1
MTPGKSEQPPFGDSGLAARASSTDDIPCAQPSPPAVATPPKAAEALLEKSSAAGQKSMDAWFENLRSEAEAGLGFAKV